MKLFSRRKTLLFLIDEHKAYMDELALEFHDTSKYEIVHCYSVSRMQELYAQEDYSAFHLKIAVISAYFDGERSKKIAELKEHIKTIQKIDTDLEMIVLVPEQNDKLEDELLSLGSYAVFQRNENAFLRINNNVRGIISKKMLERERRLTHLAYWVLFLYVIFLLLVGGGLFLFAS